MIIQCEQCRTKFKLDDEKVSDRGVRVRCVRCRNVFTVRKPVAELEPLSPPIAPEASIPAFAAAAEAEFEPATPSPPESMPATFAEEPATDFNFGEIPEPVASADETVLMTAPSATPAPMPVSFAEEPSVDFSFGDLTEPVATTDETVLMTSPPSAPAAMPSSFAEEPAVDFSFGDLPEPVAATDASFDFAHNDTPADQGIGNFEFGEVSFPEPAPVSRSEIAAAPAWGDETVVMAPPKKPEPAPEAGFDFGVADLPSIPEASTSNGFDFGTIVQQSADETPAKEIAFEFGDAIAAPTPAQTPDFDFTSKPKIAVVAAPDSGADVDFGSFDFGDISVSKPDDSFAFDAADISQTPAAISPSSPVTAPEGDFGFSFDDAAPAVQAPVSNASEDGFGFSFDDAPVQQATASASSGSFGFSFDDAAPKGTAPADDQGGFDLSSVDFGSVGSTTTQAAAPVQASSDFSLGDIDFGGDTAPVAVHEDSVDKSSAALFAFGEQPADLSAQPLPAAPPVSKPPQEFVFEPIAQHHEEAPPLSISSRRRQSPAITAIIGIIVVAVVAVLGYFGFQMVSGNKPAPVEEGKIAIQNLNAYFLPRSSAGELLVINGEAVNNFKKSRASLQVKAMLFAQGSSTPVLTKLVFAGNQLTPEQLATMPADKIEAAMNNQFGDSLSNLEVQQGKAIPFTVVIINPPPAARDYGVEPVGSTVAAGK